MSNLPIRPSAKKRGRPLYEAAALPRRGCRLNFWQGKAWRIAANIAKLAGWLEPRDQAVVALYSSVSNRGPRRASIIRLASATMSSVRLFSRLEGLSANARVESREKDRCPPALPYRAYLNSISLILDCCHRLRCRFGAKFLDGSAGTRMRVDAIFPNELSINLIFPAVDLEPQFWMTSNSTFWPSLSAVRPACRKAEINGKTRPIRRHHLA
jgi:hypothetical protein